MIDYIVWLDDHHCHSTDVAGGKGASLAKMTAAGMAVPPAFVVTANALTDFLNRSGVLEEVGELAVGSGSKGPEAAERIQGMILGARLWDQLSEEIVGAYNTLGDGSFVAVRSSACAEDGETASFAGQQESFLNVAGAERVLEKVVECWASFFSERALFYRQSKGSLADLGMAVVVQRQIASDKSGVMFTHDPIRQRSDQMIIEAAYGLGEALVSGLITPDNYIARRDGRLKRFKISRQDQMIVRDAHGGTVTVDLDDETAEARVLDENEIARLVEVGMQLESAFGAPQDIEWAFQEDQLYVLQARPITA